MVMRHMNDWAEQGLRALEHHLISLPQNSVKLKRLVADASAMSGPPYSETSKSQINSAPCPEMLLGPGPGWGTGWEDSDCLQAVTPGGETGADGGRTSEWNRRC